MKIVLDFRGGECIGWMQPNERTCYMGYSDCREVREALCQAQDDAAAAEALVVESARAATTYTRADREATAAVAVAAAAEAALNAAVAVSLAATRTAQNSARVLRLLVDARSALPSVNQTTTKPPETTQ